MIWTLETCPWIKRYYGTQTVTLLLTIYSDVNLPMLLLSASSQENRVHIKMKLDQLFSSSEDLQVLSPEREERDYVWTQPFLGVMCCHYHGSLLTELLFIRFVISISFNIPISRISCQWNSPQFILWKIHKKQLLLKSCSLFILLCEKGNPYRTYKAQRTFFSMHTIKP